MMNLRLNAKWAIGAAVLSVLLAVLLAACGGDDSTDGTSADDSGAPTEVAIGTTTWIGYGPLWIADDQGFDLDNGVDIKMVNFTTDQDLESGYAGGKFQGFSIATNNQIRLADLDIDFEVVLMEDFSLTADSIVSCNPQIKSIDDLAGAKVAFEELSVSDLLLRYALEQAGIGFDEIEYVPIPAADAGTAAVAGKVDVAVTYEPYLQAALDEGDDCKIIFSAEERPGLISDPLSFSPDFIESNPDAVVGVLRAWDDAVEFYNSNTEEAQAIVAEAVGEKPDALASSFDGIKLFSLQESQDFLENDFVPLWDDIGQIMVDQGQIEEVPDAEDHLNTDMGQQALEG
ncbi:MAG: ABC transporter substrate-binding protein [Acidobacteria bacterium]|nr:MAG: ABC transporter substrate-binding protein [Acidobacteriota bacterium]